MAVDGRIHHQAITKKYPSPMTTREFLAIRKLGLIRALFLRFGPGWPNLVRRQGIPVSYRDLCSTSVWNATLDRLEEVARSYGYRCPLDNAGDWSDLSSRISAVLKEDLREARLLQDPAAHPTAGGLECPSMHPNDTLPLAQAFAKAFNLPGLDPAAIPEIRSASIRKQTPDDKEKALHLLAAEGFRPDDPKLAKFMRSHLSKNNKARKTTATKPPTHFKRLTKLKPLNA